MATDPEQDLVLRDRVDDVLGTFLNARRKELEWLDERSTEPMDEVIRLVQAGGRRLRPAFCYWGFRAAGGPDGAQIIKAAAGFELLHTMALLHDDVMDGSAERRGQASAHVRQTDAAALRGAPDPDRIGRAVAILAGDLASVMADQLFLEAGFPPARLTAAMEHYHRMRLEMAAGQYLDLMKADTDVRRLAYLKGGSYTVEGPLLFGAVLAGGSVQVEAHLRRFGEPLGEAFQLLDDIMDGEAPQEITREDTAALIQQAKDALDPLVVGPDAAAGLERMADLVGAH